MNRAFLLVFTFLLFITGCATTQLSNLQRRSIETKELEGSFDDAFKATLQVLQDYGYVMSHTDYKAGVIKGETGEKQGFWTYYNHTVTATIEQFGENRVKERITFLYKSGDGVWIVKKAKIIEDPKVLQKIYDDIQKEIFVRQQLDK